ncbi:MAG: hypothetical protein V4486_02640 [Patescibacteria group bacterium]
MEPNFQTSFIPKKPMIEERVKVSHPIGIFMIAALFLLVAMIIATGGLYFYKGVLSKAIEQNKADLNLAKGQFEPAKIAELQVLDKRLRAANEILSHHVAISPIFKALEDVTLKTVRYTKFSFDDVTDGKIHVSIQGTAVGYRSIALQSDLFTKNKNLIDPVFSNLVLDDKGNVVFNLDFTLDPTFVDYKHTISVEPAT